MPGVLVRGSVIALALLSVGTLARAQRDAKVPTPFRIGEQVDYDFGGVKRGEVVGYSRTGWVEIQRPDGHKITLPPDKVKRLSAGTKSDESGPPASRDDNPFSGDDESARDIALRKWTDRTGKHTVEATLIEVRDGRVKLRRADGKEVSLELKQLNEADQQFLTARPAGSSAPLPSPVELSRAKSLDSQPSPEWSYQPEGASSVALPQARIPLDAKLDFFDRPVSLFVLPDQEQAYVVFSNESPRAAHYSSIALCNLKTQTVEVTAQFATGQVPIAIAPHGQHVLARSQGNLHGQKHLLSLFSFAGGKSSPMLAWQPYPSKHKHDPNADAYWAHFLDNEHLLTASHGGIVALWKVTDRVEPIYSVAAAGRVQPALSPGGRYLAIPVERGVLLFEALSGNRAGFLATDDLLRGWCPVGFDLQGNRLAMLHNGRLRVWNLQTQQIERDFPITPGALHRLDWVSDDCLLIDGRSLIDVERRVHAWQYLQLGDTATMVGSRLWHLQHGSTPKELILTSAQLPDAPARQALAQVTEENALLIKPGLPVKLLIEVSGTAEQQAAAREALEQKLTANGMQLADKAAVLLVATVQTGKAETIEYRQFGVGFNETTKHEFTPEVLEVAYFINGKSVWRYVNQTMAPLMIDLSDGESIDTALRRATKQDLGLFGQIWLPQYIAGKPDGAPYGESAVPADG